MSETTSTIIQAGALGILLLFMAVSIRYLAQELKAVRYQLQELENSLLSSIGLPTVPNPNPPTRTGRMQ
jgi:hypothetical protein